MNVRKLIAAALIGFCAVLITPIAEAYDGSANAKITQTDVMPSTSYSFRVFGVTSFCATGTGGFAYLNSTDANYSGLIATLLMAKTLGTSVLIYYNLVGGYCHIEYVTVGV